MDHQRDGRNGQNRVQSDKIQCGLRFGLQVQVADGNRHRVHTRLTREKRGLVRVGSGGGRSAGIADKADLAFAGHTRRTGQFCHSGRGVDVLPQGQA